MWCDVCAQTHDATSHCDFQMEGPVHHGEAAPGDVRTETLNRVLSVQGLKENLYIPYCGLAVIQQQSRLGRLHGLEQYSNNHMITRYQPSIRS